jgi:hypothetical protein
MTEFVPMFDGGTVGNHRQVRELQDDVANLKRALSETDAVVKEVQRLYAVTEALWRILQEEHGYDDQKLRAMIAAIDQADRAASKADRRAQPCTKCGRPLAKRLPRCIYCGAEHSVDPFAR